MEVVGPLVVGYGRPWMVGGRKVYGRLCQDELQVNESKIG